jgi:acetylornithine deacetylase/succinyl-diaminopimelate desuccinylase-like protein
MNADQPELLIDLLKSMIAVPSFSKEESGTADLISNFLSERGISVNQHLNNIWAVNRHFSSEKKTLLLNSHHDTVKPNPGYTKDPFNPEVADGKLFGLGSNDAGSALVSLIGAFTILYERNDLPVNLVLAATAEEEISGKNGVEGLWPLLPGIDFAIVGEPTLLEAAIAEKGLMVLDCIAEGKAGHAAREEGINAIYQALSDIEWFRTFQFPKVSETLGPVRMNVTVIQAGQAHNQVPAECRFTVDVRATDAYTMEELLDLIRKHVNCSVTPRSMRMRPSSIAPEHPLTKAVLMTGSKAFGSPTTSDRGLIPVPSIKIGPGDSARSHSADEYIFLDEIETGLKKYLAIIQNLSVTL